MNYTVIILLCYLAFGLSAYTNGPPITMSSISEEVKSANLCVCVCCVHVCLLKRWLFCEVTLIDQLLCQILEDVLCAFCSMKQCGSHLQPPNLQFTEPLDRHYKCCLWKPRKENLLSRIVSVLYHCSSNRQPIFTINIQEYETQWSPSQRCDG